MLGFDAINEFASFVYSWATFLHIMFLYCTCLSQYYTGRYPACFGGEPPRGIPSFFFVLYVATIRAGGYAKTSIQRPATAMSAHNKMHASTGG